MSDPSPAPLTAWSWPNQARAAVSLTYDDGRYSHLDVAVPDLERFHFRGTFYLTHSPYLEPYVDRWREVFARGHEIGNHSYHHPSREELSGYNFRDILTEVGGGALWLETSIGRDRDRSFAYPYGVVAIGAGNRDRDSYTKAIAKYHKVARAAGGPPNDPRNVRPPLTIVSASLFDHPDGFRLEDLRDYCEAARRDGHWAVIMFHDLIEDADPEGNQVSRDVHLQFLAYLRDGPFWVAPVKEVANYIFRRRR